MGRGTSARAVALMLAAVMGLTLLPAAAGATTRVPDKVDPPAPGESQPLANPTEPAGQVSIMATPTASFRPTVTTSWPVPYLEERRPAADRFASAVALSKAGFPDGAATAIVTRGDLWAADGLAIAAAGSYRAPLLASGIDSLPAVTRAELQRLGVKRVLAFGLRQSARDQITTLGITVTSFYQGDVAVRSFAAARQAVADKVVNPATVVVVNSEAAHEALTGPAFAAAARYPILMTPSAGGNAVLRQQVAALGATSVLVIGSTATVSDAAVAGLPVRRIGGTGVHTTAASIAGEIRRLGLTGRVAIAPLSYNDVFLASALTGARRRGPILLGATAQLPTSTMTMLSREKADKVTLYGASAATSPLARCQLTSGRARHFRCVEGELNRQGYNTGTVDGRIDHQTVWSFYAFEKVARTKVDGIFTETEWNAMVKRPTIAPRRRDLPAKHVEIDLSRQLILLFRGGKLAHAFHTSTGKPSTPTIRGTFTVYEKRSWYQPHNGIYKGIFFKGGYAIHGYKDIPLYPASAGCARTYNGDQDFLWPKIALGERVAVY